MDKAEVLDLLFWYKSAKRDLPWRKSKNLARGDRIYQTWISEVMSQQSTIKTVVPRFTKWMQKFPNLESLRKAHFEEVLELWQGLGYYSRARNLLEAAKSLTSFDEFRTWSDFKSLKGVGDYTAKAIASIALDEAIVPLDGNIMRVASRYFGIEDPLNNLTQQKVLESYLGEDVLNVSSGQRGDFAQALMELGALVCRPGKDAKCTNCPLSLGCRANLDGKVAFFPLPKQRLQVQKKELYLLLFRSKANSSLFLFRKIPLDWPLGGQWEIPWVGSDGWLGLRKNPSSKLDDSFKGPKIMNKFNKSRSNCAGVKHQIMNYSFRCFPVEAGVWSGSLPLDHGFFDGSESDKVFTTQTRKVLKLLKGI